MKSVYQGVIPIKTFHDFFFGKVMAIKENIGSPIGTLFVDQKTKGALR
jgi:hypothetical protein